MGSLRSELDKPHAVFIPYPAQGHINPMLKLAKILHQKGFHITFVNTEFNHRRLQRTRGPESLRGLPSFRFETIPDGLPQSDADSTQDIPSLCESTSATCLGPFKDLLARLNNTAVSNAPPVSCIVSDGVMSFTVAAAEELGIPEVLFWTTSACGFLGYMHYTQLLEKGYFPFKVRVIKQDLVGTDCFSMFLSDESYLTNGYLETELDWVKGMKGIRLRDLPSFFRTTNPDEYMFKFLLQETGRAGRASAVILNTFDALEHEALMALKSMLPAVYTVGPLQFLQTEVKDSNVRALATNLWKEDTSCLEWLDTKEPNSVVYVNYGSITVMTPDQLSEFAWGLANSKKPFLWIVRPDLVTGEGAILPPEFMEETKDRGMLSSWCPQEQVLAHPAIGGFLTHNGWNSTLESICSGVPMLCWPFFAEQQTNCHYACSKWGIGREIDSNVKRDEVEKLVRELMEGEKGGEMKKKAMEWKKLAEEAATSSIGSSHINIEKLINLHLLPPKY
nr:7-deoxyloganetin glucosyltransferase-like [Ipomoea batatas]